MRSSNQELYKVVLAGESGVGKSSIMRRLLKQNFNSGMHSTIGADYGVHSHIVDGVEVRLQVWDTAGQEKFHSLSSSYFRMAQGIFLVFSLAESNTLKSLHEWVHMVEKVCESDTVIILLGNKNDISEPDAEIQTVIEEIQDYASAHHKGIFRTFWCSAKDDWNIAEPFAVMADEIHRRRHHLQQTNPPNGTEVLKLSSTADKKMSCCKTFG